MSQRYKMSRRLRMHILLKMLLSKSRVTVQATMSVRTAIAAMPIAITMEIITIQTLTDNSAQIIAEIINNVRITIGSKIETRTEMIPKVTIEVITEMTIEMITGMKIGMKDSSAQTIIEGMASSVQI